MTETFIILFLIAIIILMIIFKAHLTAKVRQISKRFDRQQFPSGDASVPKEVEHIKARLDQLSYEMKVLRAELLNELREQKKKAAVEEVTPTLVTEEKVKEEIKPVEEVKPVEEILPKQEPIIEPEKKEEIRQEIPVKEPVLEDSIQQAIPVQDKKQEYPLRTPLVTEKPKRKKTDFERFIGENLINKIGIAILVIGVGLFIKFAIDKNWINEWARVFIGFAAGGILIGLGHYFRKSYHAFSSVLVGGGLAVFYFAVAIAFREYALFSQTVAFIIMVAVTALSVILSLRYNRLELAIISLIGGFATPFMVSDSEGNYKVLFTYILILDVGMLVMAYFKKWNIINLLAFLFTILIFGGWLLIKHFGVTDYSDTLVLMFGAMFFVVFFLMNIINNIRENRKFRAAEISMIVADSFLFLAAGMYLLEDVDVGKWQGLMVGCLAAFNLVFAIIFYLNKRIDRSLIQLLIGQTVVFISLIAPVQLKGNYITMFWAAEAVLLLWFSGKSGIRILRAGSLIMLLFMAGSMFWDWVDYYTSGLGSLPIVLNRAFITGFISVLAIGLSIWLVKREKNEAFLPHFSKKLYVNLLTPIFLYFLYVWLFAELFFQMYEHDVRGSVMAMVTDVYTLAFFLGMMIWARIRKSKGLMIATSIMGLVGVLSFLAVMNWLAIGIRNDYLEEGESFLPFLWHYAEIAMVISIVGMILNYFLKTHSLRGKAGSVFLWFATIVGVYILSTELVHLWVIIPYQPFEEISAYTKQAQKFGLPILWGVCSFVLLFIGMKRFRMLRIISLSLFFITLLKLAIFDLRGISDAGRIAAFISLGVILLVMSFMYQKVKKLIFEESREEKENQIKE